MSDLYLFPMHLLSTSTNVPARGHYRMSATCRCWQSLHNIKSIYVHIRRRKVQVIMHVLTPVSVL